MAVDDMTPYEALIKLHERTDRQGPGDDGFSRAILARLPEIPPKPAIADLGCGTGSASILLAQQFGQPVLCVDMVADFLRTLETNAAGLELSDLIKTCQADMGALDPDGQQFDLLWSEGAAYVLTFEGAMTAWRPLMAKGGLAVVSEMSWFGSERPAPAAEFWDAAYPQMASEDENCAHARAHGFEVLFRERLPTTAWWDNYYGALLAQIETLATDPSDSLQAVIDETREEIALFRAHSDHYGYTFYALQAV